MEILWCGRDGGMASKLVDGCVLRNGEKHSKSVRRELRE